MSKTAFLDEERKHEMTAEEAAKKDKSTRYFCPNPECTAEMYVVDGPNIDPYFAALKRNAPHIPGCIYAVSNGGPSVVYDGSEFKLTSFITDLELSASTSRPKRSKNTSNGGKSGKNREGIRRVPPNTIEKLYEICKEMSVDDPYGDSVIGKILLDQRSMNGYQKCLGSHMVEAVPAKRLYDKKKTHLYLVGPANFKGKRFLFCLNFWDFDMYLEYRNIFYEGQRDRTIKAIITAGFWKKSDNQYNCFEAEILEDEQIFIIYKEGAGKEESKLIT